MYDIEILSAPSILGLKPGGVERLGECLLAAGLAEKTGARHPVIHVPVLNETYSTNRDEATGCLNAASIKQFSLGLCQAVTATVAKKRFAMVLGGDCSILLGIMPALKARGTYGLVFIDAHADFYQPEKSLTGEVADMDLAIVTGRGPSLLTDINHLAPYVKDEHVIHIGQRDWEETIKYGSQDIRATAIPCISLEAIESMGIEAAAANALQQINKMDVEGCWIHFDTDVLADEINPAVDYRLPGGLSFHQAEYLLRGLLLTGKIAGISITIFNPSLDKDGRIAPRIASCLGRSFNTPTSQNTAGR